MLTSYLQKYFLSQATSEKLQFYRFLQFMSFVSTYSGKKEIVNGQISITIQFRLLDFMKTVQRKFRQLLFFPVVNVIQETKRGPWIIQIVVAEPLMKDAYPFHLPPSFFTYSNLINIDVKLSIILALAQDD